MKHLIIGIAGGTGSGKTTFANKLIRTFKDEISLVCYDNYYKSRSNISPEERKSINYDHPEAFDTDLLINNLKELKKGNPINSPVYDFVSHDRSKESKLILPNKIILVEGIFTLQNENLRNMLDIKVYVESDADERILRRSIRDIKERGRTIEDVFEQYTSTVKPMHELYVEPTKKYADIVLNGGLNDVALDIISSKILLFLNK